MLTFNMRLLPQRLGPCHFPSSCSMVLLPKLIIWFTGTPLSEHRSRYRPTPHRIYDDIFGRRHEWNRSPCPFHDDIDSFSNLIISLSLFGGAV
jgi:hypothetical protein